MALVNNIGIGKCNLNLFKYLEDSVVAYFDRDKLNTLKDTWEEFELLPNREEVLSYIKGKLPYPSDQYKIWLEGTWYKGIKVHLTYYSSLSGDSYDDVLCQLHSGIHVVFDNELPSIVYDSGIQAWADRLVGKNIGYRFNSNTSNKIVYEPCK